MSEPITPQPQPPYADAEVQALALCVRILAELDNVTRQRLLAYLVDRFPRASRD
jgi:hypothetical protein